MTTSNRVSKIESFKVMDVVKQANELENAIPPPKNRILHLEVGQPSEPPPSEITDALTSSISTSSKNLQYSNALGSHELRSALSNHYYRKYEETTISIDDIAVTNGASAAFVALFACAFDAGDCVMIISPGYPCYRHVLRLFNIQVIIISTSVENQFQPSMEQLEENYNKKVKGIIVCSPSNPTGTILTIDTLNNTYKFCKGKNILLIVDEVYHGISRTFLPTALQIKHNENNTIIVIGSMSKYWCMTGFRIGWIITKNPNMIIALEKCIQNMAICAPTPCQHSATIALSGICDNVLNERVKLYFKGADRLTEQLRNVGFEVISPQGGFYVYANCEGVCRFLGVKNGSMELCKLFLNECGVACTPGVDFDDVNGNDFIRFSCAGSVDDVVEAGDRIARLVADHHCL